jgi:hypothetical protein
MSHQILCIEDVMVDSEIPRFFKRATNREYSDNETCVNDIRRLLMLFFNERLCKIAPKEKILRRDLHRPTNAIRRKASIAKRNCV